VPKLLRRVAVVPVLLAILVLGLSLSGAGPAQAQEAYPPRPIVQVTITVSQSTAGTGSFVTVSCQVSLDGFFFLPVPCRISIISQPGNSAYLTAGESGPSQSVVVFAFEGGGSATLYTGTTAGTIVLQARALGQSAETTVTVTGAAPPPPPPPGPPICIFAFFCPRASSSNVASTAGSGPALLGQSDSGASAERNAVVSGASIAALAGALAAGMPGAATNFLYR